jgi:H+-translocating NAD(P) transhydrogenase subunit alpha
MIIGVLKEPAPETRVSLLAEQVAALIQLNCKVWVETGAGEAAFCTNEKYQEAGAILCSSTDIAASAAIVLCIHPPANGLFNSAKILLGVYQPLYHPARIQEWASQQHTVFSMDMLPRTTRAQSMDVLSSQANIAGYKAVVTAANLYPKYFPMLMTAAGSIAPAKLLILGAGVAGLQAIATARRMGAVVEIFDTRPAVKEEVQSLGAKFIDVAGAADASTAGGYAVEQSQEFKQRQQAKIAESVAKADIVITTAQIPGKKAPVLITEAMLNDMKNGSVIIDLAAATGGNTSVTQNNTTIVHRGVTVVGQSNLPATMPSDASKLYGKNIVNFLKLLIDKEGQLQLNFQDDLIGGTCIAHNGKITNEKILALL